MKRDWEQTKADVHAGGRDIGQNVGDTVKQMAGKEEVPNSKSLGSDRRLGWDDVETPIMYGYGAREQYGAQHNAWNDGLESTLRSEWDTDGKTRTGRTWDEVKAHVRRGYERSRT